MDVSSGQKDNKGVAHSSAEFPNQMYDLWCPNLNLICLWRMIHVGAKREQALNQNNLNAGPAERVQSCALCVVSRLMRAAGISSEMETGGDAYDSTSHKQHQHFLWCTLNKSYGTMRARSFVAMVIEGFFFPVASWTLPTRGTSLGETIAAGAENVELMNSHQKHSVELITSAKHTLVPQMSLTQFCSIPQKGKLDKNANR